MNRLAYRPEQSRLFAVSKHSSSPRSALQRPQTARGHRYWLAGLLMQAWQEFQPQALKIQR